MYHAYLAVKKEDPLGGGEATTLMIRVVPNHSYRMEDHTGPRGTRRVITWTMEYPLVDVGGPLALLLLVETTVLETMDQWIMPRSMKIGPVVPKKTPFGGREKNLSKRHQARDRTHLRNEIT